MTLPPLPKTIQGLAGPITVRRPLVCDKDNPLNVGLWLGDERTVLVKATLGRDVSWVILLHELTHAAIEEAGIRLSHTKEEQIAEAVASGMIHVVRHLTRPVTSSADG